MIFKINSFKIEIENIAIIVAFLNIIPKVRLYLESYYVCFLFILFHELSHMFVASIFGAGLKKLCIKACGLNAVIDMSELGNFKKCIIYIAGPLSNLLLAFLFVKVPLIFYTNISLMVINIIPIKPLDGYNILNIILESNKNKERVLGVIQNLFFTLCIILGLIQIIVLKNPSILLILTYVYMLWSRDSLVYKNSMYQKYYKNITNFLKNY